MAVPSSSTYSTTYSRPTSNTTARPDTAQSRPNTARPLTAASSRHEGSYIVAVIESRGVGREVGIAALDKETGRVALIQLADSQTYVKTLHHLQLHYPCSILVPDTSLAHSDVSLGTNARISAATPLLTHCLREEFPYVPLEPIARKHWNENVGLQYIDHLCVENGNRSATLLAVSSKYYALSASAALFKHTEAKLNTRYAPKSLCINYTPVEGTMLIDTESAKNLELVGNNTNRKSKHSLYGSCNSSPSILNHTWTAMAARLLRVNLLSPITSQSAINARLDAVEELMRSEDVFNTVKDALRTLNRLDLDKLIVSLASSEIQSTSSAKYASQRVSQLLNLRGVVKDLPNVQNAVKGCRSALLNVICEMVSDERLAVIDELLTRSLNEDVMSYKGTGLNALNARVYAVKANFNRLLDVARETYKENVGDIFELNRTLSEQHELPLQLVYQEKGFVFALKKTEGNTKPGGKPDLPVGVFVNVTIKKGKFVFESIELKKRNARFKDALDDAIMLSDQIIRDLTSDIVSNIGALYKVSEAIALLDMLWSFAHLSILRNYVRPEFTGTLAIKGGRHPILETLQLSGSLVPNDVYCCDTSSFQIIQGPNMSGKSTYVRQVGLLSIMAMSGCFVPAEYASFKLHDALLTRLSNDDDIERSLSTFASEMSTSAMILGEQIVQDALQYELGRGTSPNGGLGISHAIAEKLIETKCFVFFATHFPELTTTLSRKPFIVNLHLLTQASRRLSATTRLTYNYKIVDGPPPEIQHYGLELARFADFPHDVLEKAERVVNYLDERAEERKKCSRSPEIALRRRLLSKLRLQLAQALELSTLPDPDLLSFIARLQKDATQVIQSTLRDSCDPQS